MFESILIQSLQLLLNFDKDVYQIILLSLYVSFTAIFFSCLISFPLACLLVIKKFYLKDLTVIIINSLMSLPPVVVGLILYLFFSYQGLFGNLNILYTPIAMIIAQFIIIVPIIISLSKDVLEKSYNIFSDYFISIKATDTLISKTILWETRYSLLIIIITGLGRALSEVGAILIVGGNIDNLTRVMTTSIVLETSRGNLAMAMSFGIALILISIIINVILYLFRKMKISRYD